jgi:hypothetical protein
MLDLEKAHDQMRHGARLLENGAQPVVDLRPAAEALEKSFASLYAAYDERADKLEATNAAIGDLDAAMKALEEGTKLDAAIGFAMDYLREARTGLASARERVAPLVTRPLVPAPDLRASRDVPVLHAIDRASIAPLIRVPGVPPPEVDATPPQLEPPRTFEELDERIKELSKRAEARREARAKKLAEKKAKKAAAPPKEEEDGVPPGFAPDIRPAMTEKKFLANRIRECFEEVAMIGMQRAPLLGDPWRSSLFLEHRMLAAIDAIVAMGPEAVRELEPLVFDSPAKDPSRVFAIAMVLGCLVGRDALASAERVFFAFELDGPDHATNLAGALKLAPHPLLPITLRTLLVDQDPAHRALAIDVLGYRGMATPDELSRASVDVPDVAQVALPYFALTKHPGVREAIDKALQSESVPLRQAAWVAMASSAHPHAARVLRPELEGEQGDVAAPMLALVGDAKDAENLVELLRAKPTLQRAFAVGWTGSPKAVPVLIDMLRGKDDAMKLTCAYALDRITNAGLYESVLVDAEEIMVPDMPDPDVGEPPPPPKLVEMVSDPRDLPSDGAPEKMNRPSTNHGRWKEWWRVNGGRFDPNGRWRRGAPYSPRVSLQELDRFPCTPGERRMLQRELIMRTGSFVRFDPHDFVVVQEESLKEWEPAATSASSMPGSWSLPSSRK